MGSTTTGMGRRWNGGRAAVKSKGVKNLCLCFVVTVPVPRNCTLDILLTIELQVSGVYPPLVQCIVYRNEVKDFNNLIVQAQN